MQILHNVSALQRIGLFLIILQFNAKFTTGFGLCVPETEEEACTPQPCAPDPPVDCNPARYPTAPHGETILEGIHQYPTRNSSNKNQPHNMTDGQPPENNGCPYTSKDAEDLLEILDKMVGNFYANNFEKLSRSMTGLQVLKAQLDYLLSDREQDELSPKLGAILMKFQKSTSDVLKKVGKDRDVLNPIPPTWRCSKAIPKHFQDFNDKIGREQEVLDNSLNSRCMSSLARDCAIPEVCREAYLNDVHSQYMLTHQVIFQQVAEQRSCTSQNPEEFQNAQEYRDRLCSKANLEAEFLQSHNFPTKFIDLFAEQVGFCGIMGYPNFLRSDWLREIMSWQEDSSSGCMPDLYGRQKPLDTVVRVPAAGREDGAQEEDCLVHLTFVSLVAYSVNLRYMVDVCEPSLFDDYFNTHF